MNARVPRSRLFPLLGIAAVAAVVLIAILAPSKGGATYRFDPGNPLHEEFAKDFAYNHVQTLVDFGPRPSGSKALERSRVYLEEQLQAFGWQTQRQEFEDTTPIGPLTFINLRARYAPDASSDPWKRKVQVLLGSHIDTKLYKEFRFLGANDSGSSTGVLLEIARVAAQRPEFAQQIELIFFDGEEALVSYTDTDGLYGSRHYARNIIRRQKPGQRPEAFVLLDMVGEKDYNIGLPPDTPRHLSQGLFDAARDLGVFSHFSFWSNEVIDDHVPFQNEGMDVINLIDMDFDAWHTPRDDMDQISPESLETTGKVTLLFLEKYLLGS